MAEKDQSGKNDSGNAADPADRGPGAHSGREEQARPHVVPGVASGSEGYSTGGTGAGDPLQGVRAEGDGEQEAEDRAREAEGGGDSGAGRRPGRRAGSEAGEED